jgi:hypothetical protein
VSHRSFNLQLKRPILAGNSQRGFRCMLGGLKGYIVCGPGLGVC